MINHTKQCRPILEFKGFDWKNATIEDRIEFCLADVGEAGMSVAELLAINKGLETFNGKPITIVETGLGYGYFTRLFITHILKYGGELHSIDVRDRAAIIEPLIKLGLWDKVNFHLDDSRTINWSKDKLIDYLNIDSEHSLSYALGEYIRFRMLLKGYSSVIGFHDTDMCWGVKRAIEMIEEVDVLELVADATNLASAGYKSFRVIRKDRNSKERMVIK